MDKDDARQRAWGLFRTLEKIAERDPEQEVQGIALPVLDACIATFRGAAGDDAIVSAIRDLFSPDAALAYDETVRAVDALLVAQQLAIALGPEHVPPAPVSTFFLSREEQW